MNIFVRLEEENNNVLLTLEGYIAQLGTTPLTKKMDEFLKNLQSILKTKCNYSFTYQKLTRFLPSYKISINKTDKILFLVIIIVSFLSTLLGQLGGPGFEFFLTGIIVSIGYYWGRKYLLNRSK